MIHGVLPSCRNDAQNQRLSDSSDAIKKQSLYLNWDCAQLWLICSKFSNAPFGSIPVEFQQLSRGHPDSLGLLWIMSVLLVTDARSSAGSTLTLIAQDDSCRPVEKCPQSTMGHHGPTLGSGENNLVARSSEGFHHWSSDQQTKIIWSCQQRHHFRQGVLSQDNLIIGKVFTADQVISQPR